MSPRRRLLATVLGSVLVGATRAQPNRVYAALSLIGNELTAITLQGTTGSHTDTSERERLPMSNSTLDEAALKAAEGVVVGLGFAQPILMVPGDKAFFEGAAAMVSGDRFVPNAALRPAIEKIKATGSATHLILITPHRSSGGLRGLKLPNGPRSLEGLGFCLDAVWREVTGNAVVNSSGLLAPFASVRLHLVDLSTGQVLKGESFAASAVLPTPPGYRNPWVALSDEAKMAGLSGLLRSELERVIPKLLMAP